MLSQEDKNEYRVNKENYEWKKKRLYYHPSGTKIGKKVKAKTEKVNKSIFDIPTHNITELIIIIIMSRHQHSDPISPPLLIVHCFRQVFRAASCISTELLYVGSSWSFSLCSAIWSGPQEYTTYDLVLISSAVSRISGSSNFDSFRDGWLVAVQLLLCGMLPPGLVQYFSQHYELIYAGTKGENKNRLDIPK